MLPSPKHNENRVSFGREEYIQVEPNVKFHVTDLGQGKPVVLIHGWPLSDAMYEYQYAALLQKGYRVGGFSMGGATVIHYVAKYNAARVSKLALFGAAAPVWTKRSDFNFGYGPKKT